MQICMRKILIAVMLSYTNPALYLCSLHFCSHLLVFTLGLNLYYMNSFLFSNLESYFFSALIVVSDTRCYLNEQKNNLDLHSGKTNILHLCILIFSMIRVLKQLFKGMCGNIDRRWEAKLIHLKKIFFFTFQNKFRKVRIAKLAGQTIGSS